jgi:hypothetical protein
LSSKPKTIDLSEAYKIEIHEKKKTDHFLKLGRTFATMLHKPLKDSDGSNIRNNKSAVHSSSQSTISTSSSTTDCSSSPASTPRDFFTNEHLESFKDKDEHFSISMNSGNALLTTVYEDNTDEQRHRWTLNKLF